MINSDNSEVIFMSELRREFLEKTRQELDVLRRSLQSGDFTEMARIAHDIKGTAGVFALDEVNDAAVALLAAARAAAPQAAARHLDRLCASLPDPETEESAHA